MERSHINNLIAHRNRVGWGEVVGGNKEGEIVDRMEKMFQWNLLCSSVIIKIRKKEWRKDREKEKERERKLFSLYTYYAIKTD